MYRHHDFVKSRCEGYDNLVEMLAHYTPEFSSEITGVPEDHLFAAAEMICTSSPMAVIWSMGITQHTTGVSNVLSLANLQMLLGNMGIPGGGVNPLRHYRAMAPALLTAFSTSSSAATLPLTMECLEKNAVDRYESAEALAAKNKISMFASEIQQKIEFQGLILQLFMQRRFEHVIIARVMKGWNRPCSIRLSIRRRIFLKRLNRVCTDCRPQRAVR